MDGKMHKFELIFESLDSSSWRQELDRLIPQNRYIVEGTNTVRHILVFASADEADLARVGVEKFAAHVRQVCYTRTTVFESIGWGSSIHPLDAV